MKKLIVLFSLLFTSPLLASGIDAGATSATCDNTTLETYGGTVNMEIDWVPNTIQTRWYDRGQRLTVQNSAQSCNYDGILNVPSTQPTRTGYTFAGWEVFSDYTPIEYIESNSGEYIDTGYSAPNGFKAQIGFSASFVRYSYIIGAHNADAPWGRNYLEIYTDGHFEIGAGDYWWSSYVIQANKRYDVEFSTVKNNVFLIGDTLNLKGGENDDSRSSSQLYLFGVDKNGVIAPGQKFNGKIYYTKIYDENNVLVRDMIPVKDINNVPCMYDAVTGQFYYNAGSGDFIAGPEI